MMHQTRFVGLCVQWTTSIFFSLMTVWLFRSGPAAAQSLNQANGHYYQLIERTPMSWQQARDSANSLGGHLATINSRQESDFVTALLSPSLPIAFAGGIYDAQQGIWRWVTGESWGFSDWAHGEPSNSGTEHFLVVRQILGWNDVAGKLAAYIVEWDSVIPAAFTEQEAQQEVQRKAQIESSPAYGSISPDSLSKILRRADDLKDEGYFTAAAKWYRIAADEGSARAKNCMGIMYFYGNPQRGGVEDYTYDPTRPNPSFPKNDVEAVKWFRMAADQGDASGQYNLGAMYEAGRGVQKDNAIAVKWYRMAAAQSNGDAQRDLDRMLANNYSPTAVSSWGEAERIYNPKRSTGDFLRGDDGVFVVAYLEVTQRLSPSEFLVSFPTNPPRTYHCTIPSNVKLKNLVTGRSFKAIVKTGDIYEYTTTAGYKNSVQSINVLYVESIP